MLYTRNAEFFREYYKLKKAQNRDCDVDVNFLDLKHPNPQKFKKGFGSLIFGSGRNNVESFLRSTVLNVAADQQSVYELIQNADDCNASFISISYNDKYLLCINNGKPLSDSNMASLINVGDSDKTLDEIGTYGIGFKIVHRLLGEDDGADAIVKDHAGALMFSWNKFTQFDRFLKNNEIKIGCNKDKDAENPWLIKLIYTCFPTHLNEKVRISDYETKKVLFENSELDEFRSFLSESLTNVSILEEDLRTGSMFFLKLAEGKSKSVIEKNIEILKSGIAYSFNFLQSLNKIYINGESILAQEVKIHSIIYKKDSEQFININPRTKERSIEAKFGFSYSYAKRIPSSIPNFYTFFSMDDEKNNFGFLIHCNAFDKHSDRRKLQPDSQSNPRLFSYLIPDILNFIDKKKGEIIWDNNLKKNVIPFNELYATFLLAEEPKNKPHILEDVYVPIKKYLKENIPTYNRTFPNNPNNIKIKDTRLRVSPSDFDCPEIEWFAWFNEKTDKALIDAALSSEKLKLQKWDIVDLLKYAISKGKIETINNWIKTANQKHFEDSSKKDYTYLSLIQEIDKNTQKEDFPIISKIKLFRFSDGNFYSIVEIIPEPNLILIYEKVLPIKRELRTLGFIVSDLDLLFKKKGTDTTLYSNLEKLIVPKIDEECLYKVIAEKCKGNNLCPKQKHNIFKSLRDFDKVGPEKLKGLELFKNAFGEIRPLRNLLKAGDTRIPNWLNNFKINPHEYIDQLDEYLVKDKDVYQSIIYENWEIIIKQELNNIVEFYTQVTDYYNKQNPEKQKLDKLSSIFTNKGFKKVEQVFFNPNLNSDYFDELQNAILKISGKLMPRKLIFNFLIDDNSPFKVNRNDTFRSLITSDYNLNYSETVAVLSFAKDNKEELFSIASIEEKQADNFLLSKHNNHIIFQYYSSRQEINEFLSDKPNFKLFPQKFNPSDFKELGILQDKELYMKIIETLEFLENLLPVFRECDKEVQRSYLNKVKNLALEEGKIYDKGSFEHRCIKLAIDCYDNTFQTEFAPKIIINNSIRIKDIAVKDDINFDNFTLSLATVLPEYKGVSDIITKIINQFTDITKTELSEKVFPISNKKEEDIFKELIVKFPTLQYIEQFAFLLYYSKRIGKNLFKNQSLTGLVGIEILQFAYEQKFTELNAFVDLSLQNKIYPSELGIEEEKLLPWVLRWIEGEDNLKKLDFISQLGVHTIQSTIGRLRNYFINKTIFNINDIAKDSILSDGELLINTLLFIKEKGIEISGDKQYSVLKEVVRVINSNDSSGNKITTIDNYCVEEIINNSKPSDLKIKEYQIFLYKGKLPKIVTFSEIVDYVYYRYNDGDYFVNNFDIYINEDCDHKSTLEKVVSDKTNNFTFEDLWKIYKEDKPEIDNPFKDISREDESYIRGIITGEYELNEKLDANITAQIKTLLKIRDNYPGLPISNQKYYLQVGEGEGEFKIIVRSAQNGLLFLDVNHWEELGKTNIHLSIYTKNDINIFENQEALIEFTKPQNKYGILKMPDNYDLDDINSINSSDKKGVWRFVFVVNEDAKVAKKYKEIMDLDEYNNYG